MRLRFMLALIAVLFGAYFVGPAQYKSGRVNSSEPPSKAKPADSPVAAALPSKSNTPIAPAPRRPDVIVKQGLKPAPTPRPASFGEQEIERENNGRRIPFRVSPAGGPITRDFKLKGKVDGVVGQRVTTPAPDSTPPPAGKKVSK